MPNNGEHDSAEGPLQLQDSLQIETADGASLTFDVVGIVEDPEGDGSYAVLWREPEEGEDEFIVTDRDGNLVEDDEFAQQVLDEFLAAAEDQED